LRYCKSSFFLLLIFFIGVKILSAQVIPPDSSGENNSEQRPENQYSLLPILGYTSDWGLFGGGLLQRISYDDPNLPFLSKLAADFTMSTKGNIVFEIDYERTKTVGLNIRSLVQFVGQKIREGNYFGIGNHTEFSNQKFENEFFFFENNEISFFYQARKRLTEFGDYGMLDLTASADISYLNGLSVGQSSKFEEDMPLGFGKSWSNKIGVGLIADSRDSEFSPSQGLRYEASFEVSTSVLGSDYNFSNFKLDLRHYKEIFRGIVLANNLSIESIQGDAPFWDLSKIGGDEGLRGYHLYRFRGNQSVLNMLELRTWLFSVYNDEIRVGSQIFWDSGRVFSEFDSNKFFNNWHNTYGGGVIFSLFNPDLLLRAEAGFSNETYRFYFGAGYVF